MRGKWQTEQTDKEKAHGKIHCSFFLYLRIKWCFLMLPLLPSKTEWICWKYVALCDWERCLECQNSFFSFRSFLNYIICSHGIQSWTQRRTGSSNITREETYKKCLGECGQRIMRWYVWDIWISNIDRAQTFRCTVYLVRNYSWASKDIILSITTKAE